MSFFPGAASLGTARGSIRIDTSHAEQARAVMRRVGEDVRRSLGRANQGLQSFNNSLTQLRQEITTIGVVGGVLSGIGLSAAASMEEARVQLVGMVGSEEEAVELMEDLRKQASRAGVPFQDMLAAARQLLPTLEGNTEQLEAWFDLVRRTAVLNQRQGIQGAAFAINEALSSGGTDLVSLVERFNISRQLMRDALEQTGGDFAAALDQVLTRMGITTQTADEMGRTFNAAFRAARDSAQQLLATGFEPLLEAMTPMLQGLTRFLQELRETNPEVVQFGASVAAIAAVGAPSLLLLNQLISAAQTLKGLGILGGLARFGVAGVVGAGLIGAGVAGIRAVGRATGDEGMANFASGGFKQVLFDAAAGLTRAGIQMERALIDATQDFVVALLQVKLAMLDFAADLAGGLASFIGGPFAERFARGQVEGQTEGMEERFVQQAMHTLAQLEHFTSERTDSRLDALANLGAALFPDGPGSDGSDASAQAEMRVSQERLQTIQDWASQVKMIEREAATARLQATRQFEQQRQQVIAQFELTIAREAEDFARQRARQQQQLQRQIADIRSDAAEREAEWWADLQSRIADVRAESAERIADIEQRHARNRERAHRDHRDRLLDAASRLDARAVAEEQRRFQRQTQNMEEELQERVEQERENLQERIEQEQEAHRERVRQAREADEERIRDLEESLRRQQRIEDEDRRIRLQRMEEDHQRQLLQLERSHQARLQEIVAQEAREKAALNRGFMAQLEDLGEHNEAWLKAQERRQEQSLRMFDEWWESINQRFRTSTSGGSTGPPVAEMFQSGGPVDFTGPAMVHGSRRRPEFMLSADTTAMLRDMLGNFSQPDLVNAVAGGGRGGGSVSLSLGDGAIQVFGAPGQNEEKIGEAVRRELLEVVRSLS